MTDGIIKGTGNSRYLKSVTDFLIAYPNYESFAQALIAGTLPIDLNGINAEGWSQTGTALSKTTLLSDETAAALGLTGEDPTVDGALGVLGGLTDAVLLKNASTAPTLQNRSGEDVTQKVEAALGSTRMAFGKYTGTGTYGSANAISLALSFAARVLLIWSYGSAYFYSWVQGASGAVFTPSGSTTMTFTVTRSGNTLSWYSTSNPQYHANVSGTLYTYAVFG